MTVQHMIKIHQLEPGIGCVCRMTHTSREATNGRPSVGAGEPNTSSTPPLETRLMSPCSPGHHSCEPPRPKIDVPPRHLMAKWVPVTCCQHRCCRACNTQRGHQQAD